MATKVCNECGVPKAATLEFFAPEKRGLYGVKAVCRECKKKYFRNYNAAHKTERSVAAKKWHADHLEYAHEKSRQWREEHADEMRSYLADWRANNRDAGRCGSANSRARKYGLDETLTPEDIQAVLAAQRWLCAYCHDALAANYHVDHVTPLSRGGHNVRANIALACPTCNHHKSEKTAEEFLRLSH